VNDPVVTRRRGWLIQKEPKQIRHAGRKMPAQPGVGFFACGKNDNRKTAQISTMAT
jgi:hypothetical protein